MSIIDEKDELLEIIDDSDDSQDESKQVWKILIIDDDQEVHNSTIYSLKTEVILDRNLFFLHAYDSNQALDILKREQDISVILLDVVMENEFAGLDLVRKIRKVLNLKEVRIVLRTGQPGYAPEIDAIRDFDINDYRNKSELTRARLLTTIISAIRSYHQIKTIMKNTTELKQFVDGFQVLYKLDNLLDFSEEVVSQCINIFQLNSRSGFFFVQRYGSNTNFNNSIVYGIGNYQDSFFTLDQFYDLELKELILQILQKKESGFYKNHFVAYLESEETSALILFEGIDPSTFFDNQIISLFCANASICLEKVHLLETLKSHAYFDQLCKLPNRSHFLSILDDSMKISKRSQVLIMVDIDHFAEINDALGHNTGDKLLYEVGHRLSTKFGTQAIIARISSDNFGLLTSIQEVHPEKIEESFNEPFNISGYLISMTSTMGVVYLKDIDGSGIEALKAASIALKRAKLYKRGKCEFYTKEHEIEIKNRLNTIHRLRDAIKQGALTVHYQPQIEISTGKLVGAEALVRWQNVDGRYISPDTFISYAEYAGLIISMGEFVFKTACKQLSDWNQKGLRLRISINVSISQFKNVHFIPMVVQTLQQCNLDPNDIEIEITESLLMEENNHIIDILKEIQRMGISIAIDDFGTGFSSLSRLQRLPINRIKIDKSFVKDLGVKAQGEQIARMVVQLGKTLGLYIIGEGIENQLQAEILSSWGCMDGQGFLYSPALESVQFESWLKKWLESIDK